MKKEIESQKLSLREILYTNLDLDFFQHEHHTQELARATSADLSIIMQRWKSANPYLDSRATACVCHSRDTTMRRYTLCTRTSLLNDF